MSKVLDLTGQTFGKLRVLEITDKRNSNSVMWRVQCTGDCNSEPYLVRSGALVSGNSTQCKECARHVTIDLTGKIFGKLKVLEISDKRRQGRVMWKVQCTGGCNSDHYLVHSSHIISGNSTQCKKCALKKLHSKNSVNFISKTASILIDKVEKYIGVPIVREFQLENRFYDAYIPQLGMLIESDGEYWHKRNDTDIEKNKLAEQYGFKLVRVTNNNQKDIPLCFNIIKNYIDETSRSLND